jgi:tetratricopeptide (TPR) repeat protein
MATVAMTPAERRAYALGRDSFTGGRDDEAMTWLNLLVTTRSDYADVHYMLGVLHERRNDTAAAARSLREALRINPGYAEAALALAGVYEQAGDYDRSREIAQRARSLGAEDGGLDPTTRGKLANMQADLGDAYARAGELREAIDAYRKALDRCPTFHDIRFRLGVALREAGLPDRALAEFGRILRANPGFAEAAIQRALTLYSLGRSEEALAELRAVAVAHPTREDAPMYVRLLTARHHGAGED